MTNLTSGMDSVKMFVSQASVSIISSLFMIIGAAVMLITINWKLALALLVIVPIIATWDLCGPFLFGRRKSCFKKNSITSTR